MSKTMKPASRVISFILCLAILLPCIPVIYLPVFAASSSGTEAVIDTEVVFIDGVDYEVSRTTRYIGNRTYSVQIDISANLSTFEHTRVRTSSKNGYITIQETGYYLLELWGGRGGDGQDGWTVAVLPLPTPGGTGANGGYVYGKVFLKAGQTLVYNIGTNGDESIVYNDEGGGVNGDGGTHGDMGSYTVGGGGGYSAIYLFEEGEFQESYVTEAAVNIPETARLSRYLMIAGGGGGGGAGFTNLFSNGTASAPNGGAGGNINNGISVSLIGNQYDVSGYVFSGRNGSSSGTSNTYVGRGGSNVPGQVSETLMGYYSQSQLPNDWSGTYNSDPSVDPGAGGSGNFRGGGGGSGYAGGSGGLMTAQLIASNVGGGGGGSSFIAETVNGVDIEFLNLTDDEKQYLSGSNNQPEGKSTGGAIQITYLSGEEDQFYQEALEKITLSGTVSKYFDVLSSSKTTGTDDIVTTVNSDGTTSVTVSGLSITPSSPASSGKTATVTLYLRAKDDFMGGNSVPLISGIGVDFLSPNDNVTPVNITPEDKTAQSYVNVPLNAKVRTNSYTSSQEGKSYLVTSLYEDDYADYRSALSSYWQYDFISEISTYSVYQDGTKVTGSVAPAETTTYQVQYTVTPKTEADPEVTVGPAVKNPTTVTGNAVISVVAPGVAVLNGLTVTGAKTLSYAEGTYDFSLLINQVSEKVVLENSGSKITSSSTWEAPTDGWYYIQAWGGDGGDSGSVSCTGVNGKDERTASAGSGGTGGYVSGYVYLTQGQIVTVTVGSAGSTGASNTGNRLSKANAWSTSNHEVHQSWAGGGGGYSAIEVGGSPLIIAGGGGGAGSSVLTIAMWALVYSQSASRNGSSVTSSISTSLAASLSSYNGSAGSRNGSGSASVSWGVPTNMTATAGSAGAAGSNYRYSEVATGYDTTGSGFELPVEAQKYAQQFSKTKSISGGQVAITLVATPETEDAYDKLMGIETDIAISRYFDIAEINLKTSDSYTSYTKTENDDSSYTMSYRNSSGVIAQFTYRITTAEDGVSQLVSIYDVEYIADPIIEINSGVYSMHYETDLTFTFSLTPKEGFLGGNDVPVLAYGQTGGEPDADQIADFGVRITQGEDFMNLPAAGPTDFANVEYYPDMLSYLSVQDKTIHLGERVNISELYTFTPPTYGEDDWEDDYAYFIYPEDITYEPTQTTEYQITVGFAPRITEDLKATIVEGLSQQNYSLTATVYVEVPVDASLTNLTCDSEGWTLWGENFGCTLTPNSGYLLPDEVTVTIGGVETENFTYNSSLGTVSIEGEYVTGPIVITASAVVKTYDIHILYTNYDAETESDVLQKEIVIPGIEADADIDWAQLDAITVNDKEGYEYQWVYETADGKRPATMPANNLWVYGSYVKAQYSLTIHYEYQGGSKAAEDSVTFVTFGDHYTVTSPAIKGYLADPLVVSGTMSAASQEITVTYIPSFNKLVILYQKADGTEIARKEIDTVTNNTYTEISPEVPGYTPDQATVEKTMTGEETETVIVTYYPNQYNVTFSYQSDGMDNATLDGSGTKLVEYDNIYGYNAADNIYDGLPTPQIAGYTFAGWYSDPLFREESLVDESTAVNITEDTTLYAKWEVTKFKLTVRYDFLYEDNDYIPEGYASVGAVREYLTEHEEWIEYGEEYSIQLPAFVGYSAYLNFSLNDQEKLTTLSGTMPGQNKLVIISYEINTYEIKFMDREEPLGSYVTYSDSDTSTNAGKDAFNTLWDTVYVKHNVSPVYGKDTPAHDTTEQYTYAFTGWYDSVRDGVYGSVSPDDFPAATCDQAYYAMYTATENIVAVNSTMYFTSVADALEYAATLNSSFSMSFRRNDGNPTVIDLKETQLVFDENYTGTITLDLNGITLVNDQGKTPIVNRTSSVDLAIKNSGSTAQISVSGDGDVVAIECTTGSLTVNGSVTINAVSTEGNATAILFGSDSTAKMLTLNSPVVVSASAENGTAIGIDNQDSLTLRTEVIVSGNEAIGICARDGAAVALTDSGVALAVSGTEAATGIQISEGASLTNAIGNTNALIVSSDGDAYGIYNAGTINSLNLKMNVSGNTAYGLYNDTGTVTVTGIGTSTDLRANATDGGMAYGLYNINIDIGAADSVDDDGETVAGDKLMTGAFAGSTYGIYSEDGTIYASGNTLYFKGDSAENNLTGVVHDGYSETDATEQFEAGYYRLAAMRTIIFVTNGGSEITTVVQFYDTALEDVETKRSGYTFISWYTDEGLTVSYSYPDRMPDQDLILYADWNLLTYTYSLDTEIRDYTIKFYQNKSSTDTSLFGEVVVNKDHPSMTADDIPVQDPTYQSGNMLYVFNGWYSQRTDTTASYVKLDGDLSKLDTDGDGLIELYAGWETMSNNATGAYGAFDTTANSYYVTSSHTSSNLVRLYFVVPADGSYQIAVGNGGGSDSNYKKDLQIYTYIHGSSSRSHNTYTNYGTSVNYNTYTFSSMKAGDVIVVQLYRYSTKSTYNSRVYAEVRSVPDAYNEVANYEATTSVGVVPIEYNVEMGIVDLPIADSTEHEGMKFAGWAEDAESERIMQITPDMVDTVEEWQNGELWQLYSQWTERTWDSYQSGQRDFTDFTGSTDVTIREDETVSVRFQTEETPEGTISFRFENGLPAGTILTLIDRSGDTPVYYSYITTENVTELDAILFTKMGDSSAHFSGKGTDLVLQICYQNAALSADSEKVSIYAGDIVPEVDASYSVILGETVVTELDDAEFNYAEEQSITITVPALSVLEFDEEQQVFLRITWDDVNLAPGTVFMVDDKTATVYDGEYALLDLGLTVGECTLEQALILKMYLPTMVQNEFSDKNFHFEICVSDNMSVAFGNKVKTAWIASALVTVKETDPLNVTAEVNYTIEQGGSITIEEITPISAGIYLYQMDKDYKLVFTENCETVFAELQINSNGELSVADGALISDGAFTATLSETASTGRYYLVVKYGDKYERILLIVSAAP